MATKGRLPVIPVIAVVGEKKSGKTSLIEKLVPELRRWGCRVGVAKRCHGRLDLDREGKDSWRYDAAGAEAVLVIAPGRIAMLRKTEAPHSVEGLAQRYLEGVDVVLVEGERGEGCPKIEVFRDGVSRRLASLEEELVAVVSDAPLATRVPCFPPQDIRAIAALIAVRVREGRTEEYLWP